MNDYCPCDDRGFPGIDVHSGDASFDPGIDIHSGNSYFNPQAGQNVSVKTNADYNKLKNKPMIDGVIMEGDLSITDLNLRHIYCDTSAHWAERTDLVSEEGAIYIYSDYSIEETEEGQIAVPAIKIGDGLAYVVDLPICRGSSKIPMDDILNYVTEALSSTNSLVTTSDRQRWDDKVSVSVDMFDPENLRFSTGD